MFIAPKVHYFTWNSVKFLVVGGAVSVDWKYRLMLEDNKNGPRTLWWDNEVLSPDDVAQITDKKVDVMLTHDCSNRTPWKTRLKVDANSYDHRRLIDEALRKARPELHFHGHMHERYDWMNLTADDHWTQTYGLERDDMWYSYGVLDLETLKFEFHPNTPDSIQEEAEEMEFLEANFGIEEE